MNLDEYKTKKCDVCGSEEPEFVIYGMDTGNIIKICYTCDYKNWNSTFAR